MDNSNITYIFEQNLKFFFNLKIFFRMKKLVLAFSFFAFVAIAGANAQSCQGTAKAEGKSCCAKKAGASTAAASISIDDAMVKKVAETKECSKGEAKACCKKDAAGASCSKGTARVTDAAPVAPKSDMRLEKAPVKVVNAVNE